MNSWKFYAITTIFFTSRNTKKKKKLCVNINMINLSLDELRLLARNRNIRDYENKSENDLISEPKPKIKINKKNLEEIKKDFNELRHKFLKEK